MIERNTESEIGLTGIDTSGITAEVYHLSDQLPYYLPAVVPHRGRFYRGCVWRPRRNQKEPVLTDGLQAVEWDGDTWIIAPLRECTADGTPVDGRTE